MARPQEDPILLEILTWVSQRFGMPAAVVRPAAEAGGLPLLLRGAGLAGEALPPGPAAALALAMREAAAGGEPAFLSAAPAGPFAAGAFLPLRHSEAAALCLVDSQPRSAEPACLRLLALFAEAAAQRVSDAASVTGAIDAATGVYSEAFLRRVCQAEMDGGPGAAVPGAAPSSARKGLILARVDQLAEIHQARGAAVSLRLMAQLADQLRAASRATDIVARFEQGTLCVFLPVLPGGSVEPLVERLQEHLGRNFRFAVSLGGAAETGADALYAAAAQALAAARLEGAAGVRVLEGGKVAAPGGPRIPAAVAPAAPQPLTLQTRYQRLTLLNRFAVELFASDALEDALHRVLPILLALTRGKHVTLLRRAGSGALETVVALGEKSFESEEALAQQARILSELERTRRSLWEPLPNAGWYAAPLLETPEGRLEGALVLGLGSATPPDADVNALLADSARLLRNALRAQEQHRQEKTLAAVTEQSVDPILLMDTAGRLQAWSRGATETFQFTAEEVLGRNPSDFLIPQDHAGEMRRVFAEAMEKGSVQGVESLNLRKDGSLVPVESTLTAIHDQRGRPFAMVCVSRDITRRKEIERMKSDFVNMVTHELRTPITAILGFSDTLLEFWPTLDDEEKRRHLEVILRESRRMRKLVNNFLDLSRLESDAVKPEFTSVDLRELALRAAETLRGYSPGTRVEVSAPETLPPVQGDPDQLERVILNLGSNALKYSPPAGLVRLSVTREGDSVEVALSDEGPGIPPESLPRLFDKFYRVPEAPGKKRTGTGLGLTISKMIVDAHGGSIRAESILGKGSTFRVRLPQGPTPPPA